MKLILVRHGETNWNKELRIQGSTSDTELSDLGLKQANGLASWLKDEDIAAIISSPLKRAASTAEAVASQHQLPVEIDARLKELNVGELEGVSVSNWGTTFSQFLTKWWQGGGSKKLLGGESFVELQKRTWACIEHLSAGHKNGTVVAVSHYFAILAMVLKALDLKADHLTRFRVDTGGISILAFESYGPRLVVFNDTSYQKVIAAVS